MYLCGPPCDGYKPKGWRSRRRWSFNHFLPRLHGTFPSNAIANFDKAIRAFRGLTQHCFSFFG